jgi:hypothetical protein
MTGPKRLWSGDWSEESAAARARMAQQRALRDDDPTEPLDAPAPPPRPAAFGGVRQLLAAARLAWQRALARARSLASGDRQLIPRGLRTRLVLVALLAGLGGAAAMIGVEAATGAGAATPASQGSGQPWLGVSIGDAAGQPGGLVELVVPGSPAAAAGVQPGDLITSIDGNPISDESAAASAIDALRPGAQITLSIERDGQQLTIEATLGTRPANAP